MTAAPAAASLTVVMYHYVRDLGRSRYPGIRALDLEEFRGQLDYLGRHHVFVSAEDVSAAFYAGKNLPKNAVLLTFDDGYLDHYTSVFPVLHDRRIPAAFFPPARPIIDRVVLDVNKIHFLLASGLKNSFLIEEILSAVDSNRDVCKLESREYYLERYALANRFDSAETIFIKRMLQAVLPEGLRGRIVNDLFSRYVHEDETAFAGELYMTIDQLRLMRRAGMTVGSHGYAHYWMDRISVEEQRAEVERSREFLDVLGVPRENWVMCYPYGAQNDSLISCLRRSGCALGFTTAVRAAQIGVDDPLLLPRLDAKDFPTSGDSSPNDWTKTVTA